MTTLVCPAKFNLFLAIGDRDESGYHELDTIFVRTSQIQDFIHIEKVEPDAGIKFQIQWPSITGEEIPEEKNSVLHAIRLLKKETGRDFNYKITLEKHIQPCSGLGGGASDAAAILLYLNEHEGLGISHEKLMGLAAQIGADVPFFVSGFQVAHGTHYGEKISQLPDLPKTLRHEIILTGNEVSTLAAYADWDERGQKSSADSNKILAALHSQNTAEIIRLAHNDFNFSFDLFCQKPIGTLLAGSGGAYVVLSEDDTL